MVKQMKDDFHPGKCLPDCMMPDGGECCKGYVALLSEVRMLRERLGPRGLEVVVIDGAGHYVNKKVKAEIERLRKRNV
jgi:hypothetical protein